MSAVDELMQHCKMSGLKRSLLMSRFYRFHGRNPHLLDFLLQELRVLRENNWKSASFELLWHHARWVLTYVNRVPGETFGVCQNFMPHYSRLAIILFPEFNSFYRLKRAKADADFGVRIAPGDNHGLSIGYGLATVSRAASQLVLTGELQQDRRGRLTFWRV